LANRARLGDRCKNPFRRAKSLALPILHRSFSRAEDVTLALAARGYREDVSTRLAELRRTHLIPLAMYLGVLTVTKWAIPG
jgi:energy-coupling factor transporter transmembrane protein EcfT